MAKNTSSINSMSLPKSSSLLDYLTGLANKFIFPSSVNKEDLNIFSCLSKEYKLDQETVGKGANLEGIVDVATIDTEGDAVNLFRAIWDSSLFEVQESLYAVYLDKVNTVLGYKLISMGNTNIKNADPFIVLLHASEFSASKVILSHNHPSGVNKPSSSDLEYTSFIQKACKSAQVELFAHIILTKNNHHSIALKD